VPLREKIVRGYVKTVGYCWHRSYCCHEMKDRHGSNLWAEAAKKLDFLRKIAVMVDFDNATEQMACEGWWG
jgi:hypothetical protein